VHTSYSHSLLVHDNDDELVEGTHAFVEQGLASGAHVLVHGTNDRVDLLRGTLGTDARLEYGFDEDLYLSPTSTLFAYQRKLAQRSEGTEFWITGTVPLGHDSAAQAAWARYESALDEALSPYPFRALCTYDARTRPASVIAAAKATHSTVSVDLTSRSSPEYVDPAAFLGSPLAEVPEPPTSPPSAATALADLDHLAEARHLLKTTARSSSALSQQKIEQFLMAVHEVAVNGLAHGEPPVHVALWAEVASLTCMVEDSGPDGLDPLTGYRYPDDSTAMGLWLARQMVDDLFIGSSPSGGCSVLLTRRANGIPDNSPALWPHGP
jgi:anti-sigma regulatory factor (Ser/Thr protein kinase)